MISLCPKSRSSDTVNFLSCLIQSFAYSNCCTAGIVDGHFRTIFQMNYFVPLCILPDLKRPRHITDHIAILDNGCSLNLTNVILDSINQSFMFLVKLFNSLHSRRDPLKGPCNFPEFIPYIDPEIIDVNLQPRHHNLRQVVEFLVVFQSKPGRLGMGPGDPAVPMSVSFRGHIRCQTLLVFHFQRVVFRMFEIQLHRRNCHFRTFKTVDVCKPVAKTNHRISSVDVVHVHQLDTAVDEQCFIHRPNVIVRLAAKIGFGRGVSEFNRLDNLAVFSNIF